ncbi:uncharacterized protein LOC118827237 [Colossoma macropomum]|uniref:uncharacterized protein LOC118827237 n=1 Tax=Colossoma macropomum TaxID=42526 RepID=UPI001864E8F6|nr:uncharacterized protein LOC118827237 [Colossoma macropomum]XP_036454422.1 uncharacterized protein LOC118827237 [Colossoma macropomum]
MKNLKIPLVSMLELLLISLVLSPALVLSFTSTKVKLHEAATLPCYQTCTGLVTWAHKDDILAQCDQTSCQSEEGFQMSHDEYLKGNLSLTIIEADFSKRKWYTCECDGTVVCDVSLRLEPFSYPLSVRVGESLTLDLPIPDDVEVTVKKTDGPNTFSLCKIEGHKAWCESMYEKRVSVSSSLQLTEVKNDDGGIYIIRDIKNDEVIGMYTVTVNGTKLEVSDGLPVEGTPPGQGGSVATPLAAVFGALLAVAILVIVVLFVKNQRLRKCLRRMENVPVSMQQVQQQEQQEEEVEDEPEAIVHSPVMETEDGQAIIEQMKVQQDEADPLLETDSPVNPPSVTEEPPLSVPVSDSCTQYSDSQPRVFK